jgi:alpha-methylacyl-CoA racemase
MACRLRNGLPLKGMRILDFTTLLPGPYAGQMLADMGAEVLRIEHPKRPDMARMAPPMIAEGVSATHAQINRNKRALSLDLKTEGAKDIIYELVKKEHGFDVVLEGFRPGVMNKLGLGYEDLKGINSDMIYCSITGYGQTGPFCEKAGHDINYLALSGLASYGGGERGKPNLAAMQIADIAGGSHHAVIGILAAYQHRFNQRQIQADGGQAVVLGQHIDISMADCAFALNVMYGASSLYSGENPKPQGEMLNGGFSTYEYYETKDNKFLSVGALEPQFAKVFFDTIGHPEWLMRAADMNQKELVRDVQNIIKQKTLSEWESIFDDKDCCVEPVLSLQEAIEHPRTKARGLVVDVKNGPGLGEGSVKQLACPIKFSFSDDMNHNSITGGVIGGECRQVLKELLNMSDEKIELLRQKGTLGVM